MASNYELNIRIGAELGEIKRALQGMQKDLKKVGDTASTASTKASKGIGKLESSVKTARRQVVGLVTAWASLATLKSVVRTADEFKEMAARMRLVTDGSKEFQEVQEGTFNIAQKTRQGLKETVGLYTRIARTTKETNLTNQERLRITESINKAIVVSGAGTESANAAIVQLSQGLASGALRGEELNSVMEQTPRVAELIAAGMGKTIGQLRELGKEGKLTAEAVLAAILKQGEVIDKEFREMPVTVAGAITTVSNAWIKYVGEVDSAAGATRTLSEAIVWVGENLTKLIELALRAGAVITAAFLIKGVRAVTAYTTAITGATAANTRFVASLGLINKVANILFVAFTGWQIGSYLREQFLIVEQAGIATVAALHRAWTELMFFFQRAGAGMRYFFTAPLDFIRDAIDDFLEYLAGLAEEMPFVGDEVRDAFKSVASYIKPASDETKRYRNEIKALNEELEREIKIIDRAAVNALLKTEGYGKNKKTKPPPVDTGTNDNTGKTKKAVADSVALAKDEVDRALAELDRLREQNLISFAKYWDKRKALMQEAIDAEIQTKKAALAAETDQNKRSKLLTEIIVLERERAEVAVNAAYEQAEAEEALAQKLEQVNLRLLELDGRAGEARAQEIATKYNDLIEKLKANNDQAGLELVHKLINVEEARAAMQQIRDDFSQSVADMQAAEQSIQAQQQTNAITALEAESQIRALREQAAVQLTQLRDKMQELHEVTKDPEVARALQEMNTQLVQIEGSTNQWLDRLKSSSVGGFKQFLIDVSEDADNAKDAFNNMAKSIVSSMRDMAAQAISENIMDLLFKGVSTGAAGGTGGGFAAMLSAFFQHSGGMVGSGRRRQVPAFAFAGAPRLHSGGYLKANEVPTVLEKGEEVLAKDDPRNAANGGGGTRILNVIDPALVHDYLASADGEKTIINTIRRNAGTVNQILV